VKRDAKRVWSGRTGDVFERDFQGSLDAENAVVSGLRRVIVSGVFDPG
jgi:hypothetical protein